MTDNAKMINKVSSFHPLTTSMNKNDIVECMSGTLDAIEDAVLLIDKDWKLLFANPSASRLLLLSDEKQENSLWKQLPSSLRSDNFYNQLHKSLEKKEAVKFNEYYATLKIWLQIQVIPNNFGASIAFHNTTEQKVALEVTEQVYRTLFEEHPDAVCSVDLQGRFLAINTAFKKLFRVTEKMIIGEPFLLYIPEELRSKTQEVFQSANNGSPKTIEINLTKLAGYPFSIMVSAIPIIINSQIIGSYGIIKDITKDQLNIDKAQNLFNINQLIMESVEDGILGLDNNSEVVMWNRAAEKITGFKKDDLNINKLNELIYELASNDTELIKQGFSREGNFDKGSVIRRTGATFYRKDGTPFICEYTITPMVSDDEVVGSVLTFRDISEKKKSEEMLRQSEKLSAVGQLAAGIAHEIRNPLTSLKGFLQLIETNGSGKKEYFEIMNSEFARIEQILNELLILSKPQKNKKKRIAVQSLLEHTITLLNTQAIIKNIEVVSRFQVKEELYIRCLEYKIKQIFINLIKNAIEAMEDGGKIVVTLERSTKYAIIKIIDEGCGIPPSTLKRLGEPFFTTKEKGTGLGLMVTYQIIEDHGGKINVQSTEGVGTTFTIELPLS